MQYFYFRSAEETRGPAPDLHPFYASGLAPEKYIGRLKGIKQLLSERGLCRGDMNSTLDEDDLERDFPA